MIHYVSQVCSTPEKNLNSASHTFWTQIGLRIKGGNVVQTSISHPTLLKLQTGLHQVLDEGICIKNALTAQCKTLAACEK